MYSNLVLVFWELKNFLQTEGADIRKNVWQYDTGYSQVYGYDK